MGSGIKRGDVVLAAYPFTDLSSVKRRPALVVSATDRPDRDCILAFITSQVERSGGTALLLDARDAGFADTGLRISSLVRCGKLMTLDRTLLVGRLGKLNAQLMDKVDHRLMKALELA